MKTVFLILFLICVFNAVSCTRSKWKEWQIFKKTFGKAYLNKKEDTYRRSIFLKNLQAIEEHNKKYAQGLVTYSAEINKFADRSTEELYKSSQPMSRTQNKTRKFRALKAEVPDSIDWRDYGVIRPIVDQDIWLSCWAFAIVAAVEAHIGIHLNRKNVTLSQENLIDCVYSDFNCKQEMKRTALEDSYQYIIENGGIDTGDSYPYDQSLGQCRYKPANVGAKIQDYVTIPEGDEEELKAVVGTIGPVSVIITADLTFTFYQQGVYYKENCVNTTEPYNHAVTVIGYGVEDGQDYWLVRNEWSEVFGDHGYIKMARNKENMCGIATYASYPIVEK